MKKQKVEISSCPFCGTKSDDGELEVRHQEEIDEFDYYTVICNCCGARGPSEDDEASAVRAWNHRQ